MKKYKGRKYARTTRGASIILVALCALGLIILVYIALSNINRVWGKAYLINANIEGMRNDGQVTATADAVIAQEQAKIDEPNTCSDNIIGGKSATGKHGTEYYGRIAWQPGTGFSQCLGDLKLARTTRCVFTGVP